MTTSSTTTTIARVTRVTGALLLLGVAAAVAGKSNQLPASFPRCSVSDPKLSSCLKSAVQVVIPELVKGVPSLGVLSIDPMEILAADISGAPKGSVAISLNFKKLRIRGLGSAEVMSISYDPKAHRISMRAKVGAPLRLDGGYTIDGRVLVLPITGSGQCSLQLDDVTADLTLAAHEITKNGQKHLAVDKLSLSFDTSKLHMRFDNLFNGNKELGDTMNTFLNQNWPDILRELKPSIDDTFGAAFQALASRIFAKVPYNNIFLP